MLLDVRPIVGQEELPADVADLRTVCFLPAMKLIYIILLCLFSAVDTPPNGFVLRTTDSVKQSWYL